MISLIIPCYNEEQTLSGFYAALNRVIEEIAETAEYEFEILFIDFIKDKKSIVLLNKSDLKPVVSIEMMAEKTEHPVLSISAKDEDGIEKLESQIREFFFQGEVSFNDEVVITNLRHQTALRETENSLSMVLLSIENGMSEDFYSIDLTDAYTSLGKIIGEEMGEDLVNEIFSKFCVGK